ncbi:protease SohB [Aquirhabdus parva]|uniref:Protease SohB n=1 Tax=Aquirhabdus parva TaxID=2283318 RepID=A0A345P518_9GAMM|nr:protease SohB [Aquirhabdus parva]AXI02377.1 protease SohB [Aquirhabdus parva]
MLFHTPKFQSEMRITHLNERLESHQRFLAGAAFPKAEQKLLAKNQEKSKKLRTKDGQRVYVLDFKGDIQASAVEHLREEITVILSMARAGRDQIVLRLESPGGLVHGYGLAAAQLARLREAGFHLTICVDKVAASGGYMMACIAQEIIAAPFAVVGSIGVVAQMPNFHKLLQSLKIDFDVYTAGKYKRTVTMFGENSEEGKEKFEEELEQTHQLFKHFVEKYRPKLDVSIIATGEHWYGEDALNLKLVDQLQTSDAYLLSLLPTRDVYVIQSRRKMTLAEKFGLQAAQMAGQVALQIIPTLEQKMQAGLAQLSRRLPEFRDPTL